MTREHKALLMMSGMLALSAASVCAADPDTGIAGHVTDGNGTAIASVVVTVTQTDSGLKRMVLSNGQGHYLLDRLPPGEYRVEAVKPGFKPLSRNDVHVGPGRTITVDLSLRVETSTVSSRHKGSFAAHL
jgi:hypothetical protein